MLFYSQNYINEKIVFDIINHKIQYLHLIFIPEKQPKKNYL